MLRKGKKRGEKSEKRGKERKYKVKVKTAVPLFEPKNHPISFPEAAILLYSDGDH